MTQGNDDNYQDGVGLGYGNTGGCSCTKSLSVRRLLPRSTASQIAKTCLKWGEVVIDENGCLYVGDGVTKGGVKHGPLNPNDSKSPGNIRSVLGMTTKSIVTDADIPEGASVEEFLNDLPECTLVCFAEKYDVSMTVTPAAGVVFTGGGGLNGINPDQDVIASANDLGLVDFCVTGGNVGVLKTGGKLTYQDLSISGAGFHGLDMLGSSCACGSGLSSTGNAGDGIRFRGTSGGRFTDTDVSGNQGSGISDSTAKQKIFDGICADNNGVHGMVLLEGSSGTIARDVKANNNTRTGIAVGRAGSQLDSAANCWTFTNVEANNNGELGFTVDVIRAANDRLYDVKGRIVNLTANCNGINGLNINYACNVQASNVTTNENGKSGSGNGVLIVSGHDISITGLTSQDNAARGLNLVDSPSSPTPIPYGDGVVVLNGNYGNGNGVGPFNVTANYTNTTVT